MKSERIKLSDGTPAAVESDGRTVWVNTWYCLGRFSVKGGIDIHQPPNVKKPAECLFCTHEATTPKDWELFKAKMVEHYGATVSDDHMPEVFRGSVGLH